MHWRTTCITTPICRNSNFLISFGTIMNYSVQNFQRKLLVVPYVLTPVGSKRHESIGVCKCPERFMTDNAYEQEDINRCL